MRFEMFLEDEGNAAADAAYRDFSKSMAVFVKMVKKVEDYVESGDLTVEKYFSSVKARNCLNEMAKKMTEVIREKDELIPQTGYKEKQRGYNKFNMGAVLVRDGFEEYGRLTECGDQLKKMKEESLNEIADKQVLGEMENYSDKLQKFCDVMADLGLYEVMLKCREFANQDDDLEDLIFMDMKTGGIGELSREEILHKRLLTVLSKDENGNDVFQESATDEQATEKLTKMLKESSKLGLGFGIGVNAFEEEDVNAELEKIQNMWGVKLKKTPKNKKGEEFVFLCQKTGAFGELSRAGCLDYGIITEIKDENGKICLGEAETDFEQRASLVETIRGLLDFITT